MFNNKEAVVSELTTRFADELSKRSNCKMIASIYPHHRHDGLFVVSVAFKTNSLHFGNTAQIVVSDLSDDSVTYVLEQLRENIKGWSA